MDPKPQQEDSFYAALDGTSAEYDNAVNQHATSEGATSSPDDVQRTIEEEQYRAELAKLEQEIATLRTVLSSKVNQANHLKQKLGITPIKEFQNDVKQSFRNIKESDTYQKTSEKVTELGDTISHTEAYQKTNAALRSFGNWSSRKLGDMRNSTAFRSVEEKVGGAYTTVKGKVSSSKSEDNFGEAMEGSSVPNEIPEESSSSSPGSMATEKVPL